MSMNIPLQEAPFPVDFRLLNQQGQGTLYTRLQTQRLALEVINTSRGDITLAPPAAPEPRGPAGRQQWCIDHHCFYITFRSGTLWSPDLLQLAAAAAGDWQLVRDEWRKDLDAYFLVPKTPQEIKAGRHIPLQLQGVEVDGRGGSRSTQVECRYQNLALAGSDAPLAGSRLHYLAIMDELPSQDPGRAPVRIDWAGNHSILNEKQTENKLMLRLRNEQFGAASDSKQPVTLSSDSKIILEFPVSDEQDSDSWALIHAWEASSVKCEATHWLDTSEGDKKVVDGTVITELRYVGPDPTTIEAGKSIDISITLVSSAPNGTAWVTVSYSGFGHLSDTVRLPVIKTPVITRNNSVGIQTVPSAEAQLHVSGKVHIEDGGLDLHGEGVGLTHALHDSKIHLRTFIDPKEKRGELQANSLNRFVLSINAIPALKLHNQGTVETFGDLFVNRDIRFGDDMQYYATVGEEPLRIIHGFVGQGGSSVGKGFKAKRTAPGSYIVTYDQPFKSESRPTVIPAFPQGRCVQEAAFMPVINLDIVLNRLERKQKRNEGFSVDIMYRNEDGNYLHYEHRGFAFIAIGPR